MKLCGLTTTFSPSMCGLRRPWPAQHAPSTSAHRRGEQVEGHNSTLCRWPSYCRPGLPRPTRIVSSGPCSGLPSARAAVSGTARQAPRPGWSQRLARPSGPDPIQLMPGFARLRPRRHPQPPQPDPSSDALGATVRLRLHDEVTVDDGRGHVAGPAPWSISTASLICRPARSASNSLSGISPALQRTSTEHGRRRERRRASGPDAHFVDEIDRDPDLDALPGQRA